ncbi:MAG: phasin family protein [Hyphomicrobium sp.]
MVASASRGGLNGSLPIQNFYQMYFGGLGSLSQTYEPATKNFARGQLEFMGLMNRRAQAILEISSRLGQCRTPQDLVNEQLRYWRTAYEQYSETAGRMMELMTPLGASPFGFGPVADQTSEDEHDHITFPEPQERAPSRRVRERKVA